MAKKEIVKTRIHVDANNIITHVSGAITKKDQIPWSRFMAMKRGKAIIGVQNDDGSWTNTIQEEFIDETFVEVIRDHTKTAKKTTKKVMKSALTKREQARLEHLLAKSAE